MRSDFAILVSSSILFLVVSVMGACRAKKNCMQSSLGPSDLYSNGVMNPNYMWYRVGHKIQVPVVIDPNYTYKERRTILGGLYEIQYKTCIDFYVFNSTHVLNGYDYVYITKAKTGCWSHIGRVGGGAQELSLGRGCVNHRTAVHEMIHALGFAHEHVRSDRDNYVYIFWQNISPGRESNFAKRNTKSTDPYGPYDYASIMHYDRTAFSRNKMDTIKPLKHGAKIGVGKTMSPWDVKKLLRMYDCGGHSGGNTHDYGHGGLGSLAHDDVSDYLDNTLQEIEAENEDEEEGTDDFSDTAENSDTPRDHYPNTRFLRENSYLNLRENSHSNPREHSYPNLRQDSHPNLRENSYSNNPREHSYPNLRENSYSTFGGHHHRTLTYPEESPLTQNSPPFSQYAYHEQFNPQDARPFFSNFQKFF